MSVPLSLASILSTMLNIGYPKKSHLGSPTILVFAYQVGWQYSSGDPLMRASNAKGYGMKKIAIFDQNLALSSK